MNLYLIKYLKYFGNLPRRPQQTTFISLDVFYLIEIPSAWLCMFLETVRGGDEKGDEQQSTMNLKKSTKTWREMNIVRWEYLVNTLCSNKN